MLFGYFFLSSIFLFSFSFFGRRSYIDWNTVSKGLNSKQPNRGKFHISLVISAWTLEFHQYVHHTTPGYPHKNKLLWPILLQKKFIILYSASAHCLLFISAQSFENPFLHTTYYSKPTKPRVHKIAHIATKDEKIKYNYNYYFLPIIEKKIHRFYGNNSIMFL